MVEPTNENSAAGAHAAHLERLIQGQFGFVWRLLRRVGLGEDRVDAAAAQVFVAAAQRIGDIRPDSERSFLFSTAMHIAALARRERDEAVAQADPPSQSDGAPALEDLDEQAQAREILDALLGQMPLELRVVFVLHEIEQLASPDIAEVMSIPPLTVASRLAEAREHFGNHVDGSSGLSDSLISAAREEQPKPAAIDRAAATVGVGSLAVQDRRVPPRSERPPRSVAVGSAGNAGSGSAAALVVKWLALGVAVGLLATTAVYAVRDAVASAPHSVTSHP